MFYKKNNRQKINLKFQNDDYVFRFCDFFDHESRAFEDELRNKSLSNYLLSDDSGIFREISWPNISYWQSYRYLEHQLNPFYVLQMTNQKTGRLYQIAIQIEVSKISLFQSGNSQKWIMDASVTSFDDQKMLIKQLLVFCKSYTRLMSLRIQHYMPGSEHIELADKLLSQFNFKEITPRSYIKTRMFDLRPSVEIIRNSFSANGRARLKIKQKDVEEIEVRGIYSKETIPYLQKALNDSFYRSIKQSCYYNFNYLFLTMEKYRKEITILGFYLKKSSSKPLAFITGVKHDCLVEFSVGGSLTDAKLRQYPFNHLLMWELALEAKKNGSQFLDMGGVANDVNDNTLSGITSFKRLFPGFELLVGKEMHLEIHPIYFFIYSLIKYAVDLSRTFIGHFSKKVAV